MLSNEHKCVKIELPAWDAEKPKGGSKKQNIGSGTERTNVYGRKDMKKREMYIFMEEMEAIGDTWTLEEVERVYGNSTLDEALADRKGSMGMFFNAIESVLRRKDG